MSKPYSLFMKLKNRIKILFVKDWFILITVVQNMEICNDLNSKLVLTLDQSCDW